jgi:hypothetical protein
VAFVVDGSEWCFDGWTSDEIDNALGVLLERVSVAQSRGERVWIGDDLQTRAVLGELSVWDLWSPDAPVRLDKQLRQDLSAILATASRYLDEDVWPEGLDDTRVWMDDEPAVDNPDLAWAHHHVRAGRAVACVGLRRSGVYPTRTAAGAANVHWVTDERGHRGFFRAAIDVERDTEATLERLAPHAYPDTLFLKGVWRGLSDFEGGYTAVRQELRRHLAVYDDHGWWAFTASPPLETEDDPRRPSEGTPDPRLVARRFELRAVEVAPERPNVIQDRSCREARERALQGRILYCHWHGKIAPHINRIHIHPPVPESAEKIVVAIFHAHLPLPGDR